MVLLLLNYHGKNSKTEKKIIRIIKCEHFKSKTVEVLQ